ncbi:uncharacterized protein LOC133530899 isoform X1 [Cydia pomonella]|uniref:uncharacterized protein LOC133530899 isoform X1 n=1 Tax=Cydia pomonella TaxID=82600 RepID=UPI002ADDDB67|nr:uncharacterized protein LOC133530899 isoform X1 [Cydia pomonella]
MDLKNLKKTRASFKSKLTIFKSYLEPLLSCHTLNNLQNHELNTRFNKIQDMYNDFDSVQTDIENLTEIPGDEHTERENFETSYFGALAAAQELLSRHTAAGAASAAPEDNLVTGSNVVTALTGGPNIKLPTIHLPTFSGRYQDWLEYHDTYKSLIHDNQSIPIIHKFHYLRSSLKDGASLVIKSLEFSSDNYKVAWDLLCERYTNDRILVNNHLNALFNINPVLQESSRALRNTIDLVNKNLRALKTLNLPTEHWDILIIHMVTSKLDSATLRDWETERNNIKKLPTLTEFTTFLRNRADLLETMEEAQTLNKPRRHSDITHNRPKSFLVNHAQNQTQYKYKCPVCKNNHSIYQCTKFKTMPVESRINKVNQLNLCTNCLRSGHDEQRCRLSSCRLCTQRHNTMLHINNQAKADPKSSTSKPNDCVASPTLKEHTQAPQQITNSAALCSTFGSHRVPLSTAVINVSDYDGHTHQVRVLLDNGSISSFITKDLQAKLKLPTYSTSISVTGLEKKRSSIAEHCDVTITSRTQDYTAEVNCFVVQEITDMIPFTKLNCDSFTIPPHIHLADPNFHEPSEVQMLLGAELFWECLTYNHISLGKKKPVLVETTLGWLVAGSIHTQNSKQKQPYTVHCNLINNIELDAKLDKFFELESVPSTQQIHTKGESECERIFTQSTTRHPDGKFVVTIPLKESPECLGDSKAQALLRFQALEHKFKRTRCLVQLGQECAEKNVSETILHDFYIDDYISGNDDKATLLETCRGVIKTLESAHFHLRKWRSNTPSLLDNLVAENSSDELFKLDTENHSKTLGLLWSCQSDELLFSVAENLKPKPTTLNPADIGSRGQSASNLKNSLLWWEGPPFLHETEIQWPTQPQNLPLENLPEVKIQCLVSTEQCEDNFTSKYSNFCKLQRIIAYMNRFVHNCKNITNKNTGPLKVSELNLSLQMLCKQVQIDKFSEQLSRLLNKRPLSHKDTLLKFNPFVDTFGIMRVGGRLASSYYDYNTKHPILLHASHHITKILVHHYHRMLMHTGPQLMLVTLRHRYWIINGRNGCRQTSQSCITCLRYSGKTHQPIMGNLPLQRVQSEYVFANTSCDYAGPILIASRKGRGCQMKKAYIVVFVYLAVRAVHLELVTDLTAMGFIAALNRFIARRGKPATILSDNGTCFIGACNELAKFLKNNSEEITSYSASKEIEFKLCPAYSPHFNGLAEGAVKQNCRSETNGAGMEAS